MAKAKDLSQPIRDRGVKLVELARKKVVGAFDDNKVILTRQRRNQTLDTFYGPILVFASVNK